MSTQQRHRRASVRSLGTALGGCLLVAAVLIAGLRVETAFGRARAPAALALEAVTTPPIARLGQLDATRLEAIHPGWQRIELHRHGAVGTNVAVTVGIPFPPGMLSDARAVHILDEHGAVIPAAVEPTLQWHFAHGGIRAVRAQFHVTLDGDSRTLHFSVGKPGPTAAPAVAAARGWPYVDGLVTGPDGVRVPGVLATLDPQWMSASLVAGPQQAAVPPGDYDRYVATQFEWAKVLPAEQGSAWLFDRPTTLFQQYVRTGRADYLAAAEESYRYYMAHIRRIGMPGWPQCGGGFSLGEVDACDSKYVYVEPILLALALTGDDSEHDAALIRRMIGAWDTGGWNFPAGPYIRVNQRFTEREAGLGLLATVSAWEITGDRRYLQRIDDRLGWLYQHQQHNPDGLGMDGSWRSSWDMHEGNKYDPATDVRGSSPWMTQNIIDALWHAWLVTGDARIPVMVTAFGQYMEHYGWLGPKAIRSSGTDWRDPCDGPGGQISWYWSSAHADRKQLIALQDSDGWYADSHNVELALSVAVARYFEADPTKQRALDKRLASLAASYNPRCAENHSTRRRFNWNNRGTGVVQWLIGQPAGSGIALTAAPGAEH